MSAMALEVLSFVWEELMWVMGWNWPGHSVVRVPYAHHGVSPSKVKVTQP